MRLDNLIEPLERLREEVLMTKELDDLHYLFDDFVYHFRHYVALKDRESFTLLSNDEVACINRFGENSTFLSECLLVILDIMEAVRIDNLGTESNDEEKERAEYLINKSVEELNRITFAEEDDPELDEYDS